MSIHFSRSQRRLEAGGTRRNALGLVLAALILGLWSVWFWRARVAIYAATGSARLEVRQENHPVDAPVGGRITVAPLAAGRHVLAGEILLEMDATVEHLTRVETLAMLDPAARQIQSLQDELAAQERAIEEERQSSQAADDEGDLRIREFLAAAELAADEAKRLDRLRASGLVSELDALRAHKLSEERTSEAQAASFAAGRLTRDLDARRQDRLARLARLRNEIAAIEGARGEAIAASDRLGYEIEQRVVRAPISGMLAEISPLKVGSMVRPGERICTIVPSGTLKVVALFSPSVALGRVREGQTARVRLDGFPWTQYGSTPARVSHVDGEIRDGQLRVELALDAAAGSTIPFQHGLPAEVDVEVERLTPMAMVLRSAGTGMRLDGAWADASTPR